MKINVNRVYLVKRPFMSKHGTVWIVLMFVFSSLVQAAKPQINFDEHQLSSTVGKKSSGIANIEQEHKIHKLQIYIFITI
ncbi:MAG: hypothetical protein KDI92_14920 [Xanthomonadales bacterium]|nr:hypothetical protein [Xanthomonadales bacterium]